MLEQASPHAQVCPAHNVPQTGLLPGRPHSSCQHQGSTRRLPLPLRAMQRGGIHHLPAHRPQGCTQQAAGLQSSSSDARADS